MCGRKPSPSPVTRYFPGGPSTLRAGSSIKPLYSGAHSYPQGSHQRNSNWYLINADTEVNPWLQLYWVSPDLREEPGTSERRWSGTLGVCAGSTGWGLEPEVSCFGYWLLFGYLTLLIHYCLGWGVNFSTGQTREVLQ